MKKLVFVLLLLLMAPSYALGNVEIDGRNFEVVDMHLHTGLFGDFTSSGRNFIMSKLPPFTVISYPAISAAITNPWAPYIGIKAQTDWAGVDRAVLLATYTHHTAGFMTNQALEKILIDPRNAKEDGSQWAWGMASINFDDFEEDDNAHRRLDVLQSYFTQRPDLFIGIKLAHAHQGVAFDNENYLGVYEVAAEHGAPVLLHTGATPFPNAMNEPEYYDPQALESVIIAYNGDNGSNRVEFVLSHVGGVDKRATDHALELAEAHDNVWLEISATGSPMEIGADGEPVDSSTPRYHYILEEALARGLVGQTIFASDGPQSSGKVKAYLWEIIEAMQAAGFSPDEMAAVLAGNFYRAYGLTPPEAQ